MTSTTPQFRRALLAMARMAEGIAEAARLLATSEDTEAGNALLSVTRGSNDEGGGQGTAP